MGDLAGPVGTGTVKAWIDERGMGFIMPDSGGDDAFVHRSDLTDGQVLSVGSAVSFEDCWDPVKCKRVAKRVVGALYPAGKGGGPPPSAGAAPAGDGASPAGVMLTGMVKFWKEERGMGFIAPDSGGDDAFVHRSNLIDGQSLQVGSQVIFEDGWDQSKNKRAAKNVTGAVPELGAFAPQAGRFAEQTTGYSGVPPPPTTPPPAAVLQQSASSSAMYAGVVKAWIDERGMGFIKPDAGGDDVFVHRSALADTEWLVVGHTVMFTDGFDPGKAKRMATWCSVAAAVPGMTDEPMGVGRAAAPEPRAGPPAPGGGVAAPALPTGSSTGIVKAWIEQRGMGFIKPDAGGDDVFVHRRDLLDAQWLVEGTPVHFEEAWDTAKGKRVAKKVSCGAAGAMASAESALEGVIKMFIPERGFGFIVPATGGEDVMVHVNEVSPGVTLVQGMSVRYTALWDPAKGKMKATSCTAVATVPSSKGSSWKGGGKGDFQAGSDVPTDNLFIAGLPLGITDDQVKDLFGQYGFVVSCRVLPGNGKPDTAAMVQMSDVNAAAWLVKNLNGNIPSGMTTPVRVNFSASSASKGSGYSKASKGGCDAHGRSVPYDGKSVAGYSWDAPAPPDASAAWAAEGLAALPPPGEMDAAFSMDAVAPPV